MDDPGGAARGEKIPKGQDARIKRLIDLGLIERGLGRTFPLARRYYESIGQKGTYTRKKGLDRKQNLALLLKHIEENRATGCKLEELCQVLPALPSTHVQSLLRSLYRSRMVHSVGRTKPGTMVSRTGSAEATGRIRTPRLTQYDAIRLNGAAAEYSLSYFWAVVCVGIVGFFTDLLT